MIAGAKTSFMLEIIVKVIFRCENKERLGHHSTCMERYLTCNLE
jgi:hypothetical protein